MGKNGQQIRTQRHKDIQEQRENFLIPKNFFAEQHINVVGVKKFQKFLEVLQIIIVFGSLALNRRKLNSNCNT